MQIQTLADETVADAIYRIFGKLPNGFFEQTLAKNPHLVELPLKLPANTIIEIDAMPVTEEKQESLNLWD